jgi:hypothetical protein
MANAHLTLAQQVQYLQARRVRQPFEKFGERFVGCFHRALHIQKSEYSLAEHA